jgi:ABC-type uncharacterized transport system permease subunit
MVAWFNIYRRQFMTSLAVMFQYRVAAMIWMIDLVLRPVIYLTVWSNVAGGAAARSAASPPEISPPTIVLMVVNT